MHYADAIVRRQVGLMRYSRTLASDVVRMMERTEVSIIREIEASLRRHEGKPPTYRVKQLRGVLIELKQERMAAAQQAFGHVGRQLEKLTAIETASIEKLMRGALPQADWSGVDPHMVKALLKEKNFYGKPLKRWAAEISGSRYTRVQRKIQEGVLSGRTVAQMTKDIRGSVWNGTKSHVAAVVRTAVSQAGSRARDEFYRENSDIIVAVEWISTLDERTTEICQALDGTIYPVDRGERPPAHVNCRSVVAPVVTGDLFGLGVRASKDGMTRAANYGEWLSRMPLDLRSTLAEGKFLDLLPGGITLEDLEEMF